MASRGPLDSCLGAVQFGEARWIVRHVYGPEDIPTIAYGIKPAPGISSPAMALRRRLELIPNSDQTLDDLPRRCHGTWRVFDVETFTTHDFRVYTAPPVPDDDILYIKEVV